MLKAIEKKKNIEKELNNTTKPTFKSSEVKEAPPSTERNISLVQDVIKKNVRSYEISYIYIVVNSFSH